MISDVNLKALDDAPHNTSFNLENPSFPEPKPLLFILFISHGFVFVYIKAGVASHLHPVRVYFGLSSS